MDRFKILAVFLALASTNFSLMSLLFFNIANNSPRMNKLKTLAIFLTIGASTFVLISLTVLKVLKNN